MGRLHLHRTKGNNHEGTRVPRTRQQGLGRGPRSHHRSTPPDAIVRVDAVTICGTDLHILKGDVPEVTAGPHPRPRGRRHRRRRSAPPCKNRAVGDRVLVSCITACGAVPLLPRRQLRAVPRRRRLDPRPPHRRHPGRVRPGSVRRHLHLPGARRVSDEQMLMLADILPTALRGRRPQRHGPPGRRRRHRRRRTDRAGRDHDAPGCSAPATSSRSTWPTAGWRPPSSSAPTSSSTAGRDDPLAVVGELTDGLGADVAIEAVGHARDVRAVHRAWCAPAATSPTSACTASRRPCIWRTSGSRTSPSPPAWSTPTPRRRCSVGRRPAARRRAVGHPPFALDEFLEPTTSSPTPPRPAR